MDQATTKLLAILPPTTGSMCQRPASFRRKEAPSGHVVPRRGLYNWGMAHSAKRGAGARHNLLALNVLLAESDSMLKGTVGLCQVSGCPFDCD